MTINPFVEIKIREIPSWIKVFKDDPDIKTNEDILNELTLIDELLQLQATKALLNKKIGLGKLLENRIAKELGLPYALPGRGFKPITNNQNHSRSL